MQGNAYWMWYPGDYEIYHSLKVNSRREQRGFVWPAFWRLDDCWHSVRFQKKAVLNAGEEVMACGNGKGYLSIDGIKYPYQTRVKLEPGEHEIIVAAAKPDGLPSAYVCGDAFASGGGWQADHMVSKWVQAGYSSMYPHADDNPEEFKFSYERLDHVATRQAGNGILYDFGRETFAQLCFTDVVQGGPFPVYYGETEEEALDTAECYLLGEVHGDVREYSMPARAFRYVYIPQTESRFALHALYEYLPLQTRGEFRCSDEKLNEIWKVAAYTFQLNSREFFLDGIKRDRWIWSGDAYQSYLVNYYLFFDNDIVKRTILALRGKDPMEQHINTILDYSLYWVVSIGEYYQHTHDLAFVRMVWPKIKNLLDFCCRNKDPEGFLAGLENDWVFVDWHEMDKQGAVCAIQMLYHRALQVAGEFEDLFGEREHSYSEQAADLRGKIEACFWSEPLGAYIDSCTSGKNHVTRHANLFAIRYGLADAGRRHRMMESVIENPNIPAITTPYFKFFELDILCASGKTEQALTMMKDYWGGMLDAGATSIWEEYDPSMEGVQHYAMYGEKYHKSLCHAWGASPVYLLGRYFLGVSPTKPGYGAFLCAPNPSGLSWMEGRVPLPGGSIFVSYKNGELKVLSDQSGGVLLWKGQHTPIEAGKELVIQ